MTREAGLWNVANVLTMVRFILVPVFLAFLLGQRFLIKGIATTGIK